MSVAIKDIQLNAIKQFAHSAETFCSLLENQDAMTDGVFVRRCAAALAALYRDGVELPNVADETCGERTFQPFYSPDEPQVYAGVRERLRHLNAYSAYFDPYDTDSGMFHLLNDDLGDIYRDIRGGLEIYRRGTPCSLLDAAFDWRFSFSSHWGHHLVSALTALHQIIAENLLAEDERPD